MAYVMHIGLELRHEDPYKGKNSYYDGECGKEGSKSTSNTSSITYVYEGKKFFS